MWAYESNEGYVPGGKKGGHVAIHRVWMGEQHRYATSSSERARHVAAGGVADGVAGYVSRTPRPRHRRLFWLEQPRTGDTIFTVDPAERRRRRKAGYRDRGVVGYVSAERRKGYRPFYRAYDPVRRDHLYSDDVALIDEYGPTRTSLEFLQLLRAQLSGRLIRGKTRIYLADDEYYCPSQAVARAVIRSAKVDARAYVEETFDCDDFAHLLKAAFIDDIYDSGRRSMPYAMGIVWGYKPVHHAMNFVMLSDGSEYHLRIIEPQRGEFLTPRAGVLDDIYLIIA